MPKAKRKLYGNDALATALAAIRQGNISFKKAEEKYGIPKSTLFDKIKGNVPEQKPPGPVTVLTAIQEERLRKWIVNSSLIGYGKTKQDIPSIVKEMLDEANVESGFKENKPSLSWVYRFLGRNKDLSLRIPEHLGFQRTYVSENGIRNWFKGVENFLNKEAGINAKEFLGESNGGRIFNCDESGFPLAGTGSKSRIITIKGSKSVYRVGSDTKEQLTVLGCVSANGHFCKPLVIYPGVNPKFNFAGVSTESFHVASSQNGWINSDIFFEWLSNLFYPEVSKAVKFPIILFVDGHTSHINLAVTQFCQENNIILYCFPPHASHILQPLDISVFGPLKTSWNATLREWAVDNPNSSLSKTNFLRIFQIAWFKSTRKENVVSGFRKAGLVPFNVENVDFSKIQSNRFKQVDLGKKCIPVGEAVGMKRAFKIIETSLSESVRIQFERRFQELYDIEEDSPLGMLWNAYKNVRRASEDLFYQDILKGTPDNDNSEGIQEEKNSDLSCNTNLSEGPVPLTSNSTKELEDFPLNQELDLSKPSTSGPTSSTPNEKFKLPTVYYEISPFKSFRKLPNELANKEKISSRKRKIPFAISGTECEKYFTEKLLEKERQEKEKQARKVERERKKMENNATKKKFRSRKRNISDDETTESETEMNLDDSEESDFGMSSIQDSCKICNKSSGGNKYWIGCSTCPSWFHKGCINMDVSTMTDKEIHMLKWSCDQCGGDQ